MCLRWSGVGLVVSRESRAPALCGGYVRAALCGPLVASRPPGDLENTTNPHCIALGPPAHRMAYIGPRFKNPLGEVEPPSAFIACALLSLLLGVRGVRAPYTPGAPSIAGLALVVKAQG